MSDLGPRSNARARC